ncbi:MAG: tripartite tricarboxylate transporter TctB family protein [Tropicimonas sp.]|uniref:tripartite tricarboxylate transporter TctB family protein n=1 Tax=Tropicimonas sp. TaxID=2067044 RepID=UPI003A8B4DAB
MSKRVSGAVLATVLAGFSALLFLQTFKVRNFPGTRFGAEIWPRAILICLGVLAVALLVQSLRQREPAEMADPEDPGPDRSALVARESIALTVFVCFGAFLLLVPRIGAYPAGAVFVFAVLSFLGPKTLRALALHLGVSIGMTFMLWAIFAHLLKVIAPAGRWWSLI